MEEKVVWILDDHKLRRQGMAGFLAEWAQNESFDIRQIERPDHIFPIEILNSDSERDQLCILGIGGRSLSEDEIAQSVEALLEILSERPLIIISDSVDDDEIEIAIQLGVRALIPTMLDAKVVIRTIAFVLAGGSYFPTVLPKQNGKGEAHIGKNGRVRSAPVPVPELTASGTVEHIRPEDPKLSARQEDVLNALKRGSSNKVIARELNLSEATVKIHVRALLKKFGASNRTQVAIMAREVGPERGTRPQKDTTGPQRRSEP